MYTKNRVVSLMFLNNMFLTVFNKIKKNTVLYPIRSNLICKKNYYYFFYTFLFIYRGVPIFSITYKSQRIAFLIVFNIVSNVLHI